LPWGPIMAFLTSSPLMSPEGFVLDAGILGMTFAAALAVSSVLIGLGSGYATSVIEKRTSFLMNQTRLRERSLAAAGAPAPATACTCSAPAATVVVMPHGTSFRIRWRELGQAALSVGLKQIVLFFALFVAVGFVIDRLVPSSIIVALFSARTIFAVPLAALVGLPLYVTGEAAVPLIQTLLKAGAGGGAMLAFMITGPATSAWVIAGVSTFMKRRVVSLYVAFILVGGIACGYLFDLLLALTR